VRSALLAWLPPTVLLLGSGTAMAAETVRASPPSDVSVTVYRAPHVQNDSLDLDELQGFALVTETRTVSIPKGETRIRFEGVADGIEPQSAIITGLPEGVLEKNHDAHVLSPAALVTATLGRKVWLVRTNRKTGASTQVTGTLVSDNDGILFKSSEGIEALRCSGLPETFQFDAATDATATPTLSALVRSPESATVKVRLSYLAHGFDWLATYTATVSPDTRTMDLGAWVTLGNSNGVSFEEAHTQVVAGRLNRATQEVEPVDEGYEIAANCWPMGTTSDIPEQLPYNDGSLQQVIVTGARKSREEFKPMFAMAALTAAAKTMVEEEQLGDLKLYRVPERTSVTSRQIKQVRLLDRTAIPVQLIYKADLTPNMYNETQPLEKVLRTRNDAAHHLGLPLPSGQVAASYEHDGVPLVVSEAPLRDIALDEEVEINAGESPDVQVSTAIERVQVDTAHQELPLIPGVVDLHMSDVRNVDRLEVTNARDNPVSVELRLHLPDGTNIGRADHVPTTRNGLPTFQLSVPAQGSVTVHFQTGQVSYAPVPHRTSH
jgi:hypothetical protein